MMRRVFEEKSGWYSGHFSISWTNSIFFYCNMLWLSNDLPYITFEVLKRRDILEHIRGRC